jgi:outer membrane lipoprotein SlyB
MGWSRNYPLAMAVGITALLLFSLVAAVAMTGALPTALSDAKNRTIDNTAKAAAARSSSCRNCGVVTWVRTVEVDARKNQAAKRIEHSVTVRMDDGSERTLSHAAAPRFAVGARVRVKGNALEAG